VKLHADVWYHIKLDKSKYILLPQIKPASITLYSFGIDSFIFGFLATEAFFGAWDFLAVLDLTFFSLSDTFFEEAFFLTAVTFFGAELTFFASGAFFVLAGFDLGTTAFGLDVDALFVATLTTDFLASADSLYEALIITSVPSSIPLFSAARRTCFLISS
jgi:hypothetical protein